MIELYKDKRVFVTGHSGFKGGWFCLWLTKLGAEVCGYSLEPNTNPSLFKAVNLENKISKSIIGDILDENHLFKAMDDFKPDIVFHFAAQPLVRKSYMEPLLTYKTNVIGTLNVLEAARRCKSVNALVNITTDKCYENKNQSEGYTEEDSLGGYDMYSSSKACSEILSSSFRRSFLSNDAYYLATARAGNVIGGGDWAQDRLIPDCIRSIESDKKIELRNPDSTRPWQFVLEPLSGYLLLGCKLLLEGDKFAQSFNFGPKENSFYRVYDVVEKVIKMYGKGEIIINKRDDLHEAKLLSLNIDKAKKLLNWEPSYNCEEAISKTIEWYKEFYNNKDMYDFSLSQIKDYEAKIKWNQN